MAQVTGGDLVAVPTPGYPGARARRALRGQGGARAARCAREHGFLPDLDAVPAETWARVGLLWLNYPNNPTAAVAPLELYEQAAALAREHDFLVCSDEAYSEIYFGDRRRRDRSCEVADRTNVLALNTLSKRSAMPGYRSGFAAGDPAAIAALRRFRPNTGTVPQEFVQARVGARLVRRGARRGDAGDLRRQARGAAGGLRGGRPAPRRRRRDDVPVARRPGRSGRRSCSSAASSSRPAGSSARPVAATRAWRSCRRSRSASRLPQSLLCRAAFRPPQSPVRGTASSVPVTLLRRNSRSRAPESSTALTTAPSGSVTRAPAVT